MYAWIGALVGALCIVPRWVGFFKERKGAEPARVSGASPDQNKSEDTQIDRAENPLTLIGFTILTVFFWTVIVGISKNMPPAWVGAIIGVIGGGIVGLAMALAGYAIVFVALREHARERIAKTQGTNLALRLGSQLLGLGDLGNVAASLGGQLLTLQFSRSDESDADLVGLELAARGGYQPSAAVSLWQKMGNATGGKQGGLAFLSTHPSGPARIRELEQNVPRVQGLYEAARRNG